MGPKTKSKQACNQNPAYNSSTPIKIAKITAAGNIRAPLIFTVESITTVAKGFKLVLSNGITSKIYAFIFEQSIEFQVGNQYVIRGSINAKPRSKKYKKLPNFKNFNLFLNKIYDMKLIDTQPSTSRSSIGNLAEVKKALAKGKPFVCHLNNVVIESGHIYRYMGCEICTTSIRYPTDEGKYICTKCTKKSGDKKRKECMMIKNLNLRAGHDTLDEVVGFNKFCTKLLGKEADSFRNDLEAQDALQSLIGTTLNIDLKAEKENNSFTGQHELKIICLTCEMLSVSVPGVRTQAEVIDTANGNGNHENDARSFTPTGMPRLNVQVERRLTPLCIEEKHRGNPYDLTEPGLALIINNFNFYNIERKREGSEIDVGYLTELLPQLNCAIFEGGFTDVKSEEIDEIIKRFQAQLLKNNSSFSIVVIMSHGSSNEIEMVDDKMINLWNDIVYKFSIQQFQRFDGKPKIFIIQACQNFMSQSNSSAEVKIADTLVVLPTLPGHYARRYQDSGTPFIQNITEVFMQFAQGNEIQKMLKLVQKKMNTLDPNWTQLCFWSPILFDDFFFKIPADN